MPASALRKDRAGFFVIATLLAAAPFESGSAQEVVWRSDFENGFPGEFLNFDNGTWSPSGTMPAGRVSAWTITSADRGVTSPRGGAFYKGWVTGRAAESHRPYPVLHSDIPTPIVNSFWVWQDADYAAMIPTDWIHFGSWAATEDWAVITMSVRDRKLVMGHTEPFEGVYIGPNPRPDFPLRKWVKFTVYVHFDGTTGSTQVWQDGVPMLRATIAKLANNPGRNLKRSHWGMYSAGNVGSGVQYNDDIRICRLNAPLTDLVTEPVCGAEAGAKVPMPPTNLVVQ